MLNQNRNPFDLGVLRLNVVSGEEGRFLEGFAHESVFEVPVVPKFLKFFALTDLKTKSKFFGGS